MNHCQDSRENDLEDFSNMSVATLPIKSAGKGRSFGVIAPPAWTMQGDIGLDMGKS
jgi:hypothetical protein